MKTLVIVRHGDANRDDVTLTDIQRPLSPLGRRQTAAAVTEYASHEFPIGTIVSSPAQRALDTASIWQQELKISPEKIRTVPEIYEAERTEVLQVVRRLDDAEDAVILFGHNPGVTGLLHHLAGRGVERMATSAFAVLTINVDHWSHVALRLSELVSYYAPPANAKFQSPWQRFVFWRRQRIHKVEIFMVVLTTLGAILAIAVIAIAMNLMGE